MKRIKLFAQIAIILFITNMPNSSWAQSESIPYIIQNTTCEKKITPDELYISITINEKDNKGKTPFELMQANMIKALQSLGIDVEKELTLNFMGSEISYTTFRRNIAPRTSATYTLKLNSADTMQKVINKLEENNITNIQLTRTTFSKAEEVYKELGVEAMKMAKKQAETLANAIGQSIGPALSITSSRYSSNNTQPRLYKARNAHIEESADIATGNASQIEIGEITFNVNVNVKFQLK